MSEESEGERQQEIKETRTYYSDRRRRAYIGREILKIYWKPINLTNKMFIKHKIIKISIIYLWNFFINI